MEDSRKARIAELVKRLAETESELESLLGASETAEPPGRLPASEESPDIRFRRLLGRFPALVFELSPDGTTFAVNPAVPALTGFRREEIIGENWWEVLCPRELSRRAAELAWQLQSGDVSGYELATLTRHGEPLHLEITTANWYRPGGALERIVGVAIDVSARRRAEERWQEGRHSLERRVVERTAELVAARKAAERRAEEAEEGRRTLDALMAYIPEGIMIATGEDVRVRRVSTYMRRFVGKPLENYEGMAILKRGADWILSRADGEGPVRTEDIPLVRATLQGEVIQDEEWVLTREDGSRATVLVNAGPIRDHEDRFSGGVVAWRDITERKRAEMDRERLLAELDSTFSAIADGVVIFDPEGKIRRINPAAMGMMQRIPPADDLSLQQLAALLRTENSEGSSVTLQEWPAWKALQGATVRGQVMKICLPEDHPESRDVALWFSVSAAPVCRQDGSLLGAVVTFTDITSLRQLQEQHELYIHTISHDLRIPLTLIYGHAQILEKLIPGDSGDTDALQNLETVLKNAERMNLMIEDLVDAARVEGGEIGLDKVDIDLRDYLEVFLRRSKLALDVGRIRLDLPPDLPPLRADAERLERIFLNLLSNALKYSAPETSVTLAVEHAGDEVIVSVTDQGVGIPPEDQPHIFERFYRPHGERRVDSVGLGLYITRMLVQAHGGRIWVRSSKGEGSTFSFALPTEA